MRQPKEVLTRGQAPLFNDPSLPTGRDDLTRSVSATELQTLPPFCAVIAAWRHCGMPSCRQALCRHAGIAAWRIGGTAATRHCGLAQCRLR